MAYVEGAAAVWHNTGYANQSARDTAIQARLQEVHDALIAAGLTEVADTGTIGNPSSLSIPLPSSSALANTPWISGVKIYRFNDALQASRPLFLKVHFGGMSQSATAGGVLLAFEIGTGTDGAAALTGYRFNSRVYWFGGNTTVSSYDAAKFKVIYSPDLAALGIMLGEHAAQGGQLFCLERLRDEDGTPNDSGIYVHSVNQAVTSGNTQGSNAVFKLTGAHTGSVGREQFSGSYTDGQPAVLLQPTHPGGSFEGQTTVYPHFPFTHKPYPPSVCFMGIHGSDIASDVVIAVSRYGVARNYKNVANVFTPNSGFGDVLMLQSA